RVLMLEASGHTTAYVNGAPRAGDVYGTGYVRLPVPVKKGHNELLVQGVRGKVQLKLTNPKANLFLSFADVTAPDLIAGQDYDGWAGVLAVNATPQTQTGLSVVADGLATPLRSLPPFSVSKVPVHLRHAGPAAGEKVEVKLELTRDQPIDTATLGLTVVKPGANHRVTFRSAIDDSVQYFSLVPANLGEGDPTPGLILTLHGAGVEASGQAACFAPRNWAHVVAATNRRPYGFDWEDWGRLDALEVLAEASRELKPDPRRIYLTGHSMGGHGTWHLGVTYPGKFAAIGPSAGWVSLASYAGQRRPDQSDPVIELLWWATQPSDTLTLAPNLEALGVFVLHGDQDDNVPVGQARTMRKTLAEFHRDFVYYERPGVGHWWGNDCVDWRPMMDFFRQHQLPLPKDVRRVDFITASPTVSAEFRWVTVEQQQKAFRPSAVHISHDAAKSQFTGRTENVARLALDVGHLPADKPVTVELDGQKLGELHRPKDGTALHLEFANDKWAAAGPIPTGSKTPQRGGPFRDAFRNRVLFVYGTKGTPEENAWALQKARFDAEVFWYRGNGGIEVVPDTAFDPAKEPDRNVVLYGHSTGNAAWKPLLGDGPVRVTAGRAEVGGRKFEGDDLACLFVRPRAGSATASVGVVCGTGLAGMRTTERLQYFVSGVGLPDLLLLGADSLTKGPAGVRLAGFFGNDWSVEKGEWVPK
ncbi:MAG: prolyl oligopeptidase family serine peptidase, partial [Gemmataceae bacterium]